MESHTLNEGEVSTEEKLTIVSSSCMFLFFENEKLIINDINKKIYSKNKEILKLIY